MALDIKTCTHMLPSTELTAMKSLEEAPLSCRRSGQWIICQMQIL
jgi:hypothetical protein